MGTENDRHFTVYMHQSPSGKRYIGITGGPVKRRWHEQHYYTCAAFYKAIQKYGWENISKHIVSVFLTREEAERAERYLISKYHTTDPEFGYNILPGGNISNGVTEDGRKRSADFHRGRKRSEETIRKIRDGQMTAGKTCSVVCFETGQVFVSEAEAERELGICRGGINSVLNNPYRTCAGYHWVREKDYDGYTVHNRLERVKRPVVIVETNQEFDSTTQLAAYLHTSSSGVVNACKGRRRTVAGFHVRYADEECKTDISVGKYDNIRKPVILLDDGTVYESIQQASDALHIKTELIIGVCKGRKTATHGMRFAYATPDILRQTKSVTRKEGVV